MHWFYKNWDPKEYTVLTHCGDIVPFDKAVVYGGSVTCQRCLNEMAYNHEWEGSIGKSNPHYRG